MHKIQKIPLVAGLVLSTLLALPAYAHNAPAFCETILGSPKPVTLRTLRAASRERVTRATRLAPLPGFDNVEEQAQFEQVGEQAPMALQQMLGSTASLVATPAPTSPDIAVVSMMEGESSMPLDVSTLVNGKRRSTAVYTSLPENTVLDGGKYIVSAQHKVALVFLHGGGTPTASGKNAAFPLSDKMAALGIPVIAPDMPGHGRATKNPDGLLTFQEMADWLMQLIDKMVDPSVKIVLAGHSWGGEFAVFMHRLSADPKYARIAHYIALSPPVDTSVGQGAEKRLENERIYEEAYKSREADIAPSDFKFLNNILRHGKNSDIGSLFCHLTNLDYSTPPLTVEEQKKLKPITVVVGSADGLVYVGREQQFAEVFGNLQAPSRFVLLGPGRTFDSDPKKPEEKIKTGHGIFDVYIEGTTTPLVYNLIGEVAKSAVPEAAPLPELDKYRTLLKKYLFHDTRYIAFREFIAGHSEFIATGTSALPEISERKRTLDDYFKTLDERREKARKDGEGKTQEAIQALRKQLGIDGNLSLEAAQKEFALPELTAGRKAELEAFVQRVDGIEEKLKTEFKDPESDRQVEALQTENAKLLADLNITEFEKHLEVLKSLQARKDLDKKGEQQRSALARMNQKYLQIMKDKQARFGKAREELVKAANPPAGISDLREALRELRVDRSQERRIKLQSFIEMYPIKESEGRVAAAAAVAQAIIAVPRPKFASSIEHAKILKDQADAQMSYTYVPPQAPQLKAVADRIAALNAEVSVAFSGSENQLAVPKLETALREKMGKRDSLRKKYDALWGKGGMTSPKLQSAIDAEASALETYKLVNGQYEHGRSNWLLNLRAQGPLRSQAVMEQTTEILRLRKQMQNARRVHQGTVKALEEVRWSESATGTLSGPEGMVRELAKTVEEIQRLEAEIAVESDPLEQRRQRQSVALREYNELRVSYVAQMIALGQPVPYVVEEFRIAKILEQPLPDLLRAMASNPALVQALQDALAQWETFVRELRRDNT